MDDLHSTQSATERAKALFKTGEEITRRSPVLTLGLDDADPNDETAEILNARWPFLIRTITQPSALRKGYHFDTLEELREALASKFKSVKESVTECLSHIAEIEKRFNSLPASVELAQERLNLRVVCREAETYTWQIWEDMLTVLEEDRRALSPAVLDRALDAFSRAHRRLGNLAVTCLLEEMRVITLHVPVRASFR